MNTVHQIADMLHGAYVTAAPVEQFSRSGSELPIDDAYAVQAELVGRRVAAGDRQVGVKLGFTSRAKMRQMGVDDLIWGRLTDGMQIDDGGELALSRYIHPRAEPEIAFLLGRDIAGPVSTTDIVAAVEAVAPAIEVIDSRYDDFRFSLSDVVADNASSAGFVVGPWHEPGIDLSNRGVLLTVNGSVREVGSTAAILGNPIRSLVAAARLAAAAGEPLGQGTLVLAGAATAAVPLTAGMVVRNEVSGLGSASFSVPLISEEPT